MRNIVFVILVMVSIGCSKSGSGYDGDLKPWQAVIETGEKMEWVFGKNYKPYTPTAGEIDQAEELLSQCFTQQESGVVNCFVGKKLEDYNRQFLGGITESGEKVIWINCLCKREDEAFKDWKTRLIIVADGGNCFFNLKININKQIYYDLRVNGNA
ncbi:MAG: hypothetical protein IAE90_07815 [Ignavibacteria bacterium]|nr:hypothetical protein [Ignavibacteria bacterium]